MSKARPQVIADEERERVHERVAAVDVAKDSGMVCTRRPHPSRPGARQATVWTVKARMGAIRALGGQLASDGIEVVTLESTRLLADLVLRAGGVRAGGAAGQRVPGEAPARPSQNRQTGCDVAGPADRDGAAAGILRAAQGDPGAARLHPDADPADPGADPLLPADGKAAGIGPGQALLRGQQADHHLRAGHDQGDDRRAARPAGTGQPGPHQHESQARRLGRGAGRHVR